jgi:beta-xylosidase
MKRTSRTYRHSIPFIFLLVILSFTSLAQKSSGIKSQVWTPDNNDGTFTNPILYADYSDPDICRVGDDFYMTSSSFNSVPALPILHSKDLINWTIINHAIKQFPGSYYDIPQHGNGVWAPCIRFHDGTFYIYWGDPDQGIYMVYTKNPAGDWSEPIQVKKAYGNIDPSPLWDDDGKVYMVHAFAHSRAGVKSLLQVVELSADGSEILDKGTIVFDGHQDHSTIEGPKFYKRNGYYYIFAPAGGVPIGWQLILRSKNIYGPYEEKIVLAQGSTEINGPHQGGWVELENGENWFVHFQEKLPYGRIVHLQPVNWINDWPVMGNDADGDGTGEPYIKHKKPNLPKQPIYNPQDTDEFNSDKLGLQWQWNAQPQTGWYSLTDTPTKLRLNCQLLPEGKNNLWMLPNILLQKFPAESFTNTVKMDVSQLKNDEESGLIIFGSNYAALTIQRKNGALAVTQKECAYAEYLKMETINSSIPLNANTVWLKSSVTAPKGEVTFSYSTDGVKFENIGSKFEAKEGRWVGAKSGLYAKRSKTSGIGGYVLIDWFHVEK